MQLIIQRAAWLAGALLLGACGGSGGGSASVTVTTSGANVVATPTTGQPIAAGGTASFTLSASVGYSLRLETGGTCPAGTFAGQVYTTGAVTTDCTVTFSATLNTYGVTASGTDVSIAPGGSQAVDHGSTQSFTVTAAPDYVLVDQAGGSCPGGSFAGAVYTTGPVTADCDVTFSAVPVATTLVASAASLALAANGVPRTLTITNTGSAMAFAVGYAALLPSGTSAAPASCGNIPGGASCVLTITPGATPTAAPGDTSPVAVTLEIGGTNTNTLTTDVQVLDHGSVYQGGYLFAVDDSTPVSASIGGKVAALADQAAPLPNGTPWGDFSAVTGIDEESTPGVGSCDGRGDGACNTAAIVAANSPPAENPATPLDSYAAGFCKQTISGYADWYLPAICELGTGAAGCGTENSPYQQNMRSQLAANGVGNLAGFYWSSTEFAGSPAVSAWSHSFDPGGAGSIVDAVKTGALGVRCARALTP